MCRRETWIDLALFSITPSADTDTEFTSRLDVEDSSMAPWSHSIIWRFSMAAGSIGTNSSRRSSVRTKPPRMLRKVAGGVE
jgi:hypothetical protein